MQSRLVLLLLISGCASSYEVLSDKSPTEGSAGENGDGESGQEGSGTGGLDSIETGVAGTGAMGTVDNYVINECDAVGARRDAEPDERAEYCICELHGGGDGDFGGSSGWECYGADPMNEPVRSDTECDGGTGMGSGDGCTASWTCDDGHTYGLVCLATHCFCQIDGVTRDVPRTENSLMDCPGDVVRVNAKCFFWTE